MPHRHMLLKLMRQDIPQDSMCVMARAVDKASDSKGSREFKCTCTWVNTRTVLHGHLPRKPTHLAILEGMAFIPSPTFIDDLVNLYGKKVVGH